jgi:hypothetical protein
MKSLSLSIIFLLIFSFFNNNLLAQKKYIENALASGKTNEGYYEVKGNFEANKFKKWVENNKDKYYLIDYKAYETIKYNSVYKEVRWFAFIPLSELDQFKQKQLRDEEKRDRAKMFESIKGLAVIGVGVYAMMALTKEAFRTPNISTYSITDNRSTSQNQSVEEEISKEDEHKERRKKDSDDESYPSKQDLKEGNIIIPSYKNNGFKSGGNLMLGDFDYSYFQFSDGTSGTLYIGEKSGKYFISIDGINPTYYNNQQDAIKALYIYKKFNEITNEGKE